jgi:PAS domain S-box-containing protein
MGADGPTASAPRDLRVLGPFLLLATASIVGIVVLLWFSAHQIDQSTRAASGQAVSAVVHAAESKSTALLADYSWWDEPIHRLILDQDADWASVNIDDQVLAMFEMTGIAVLDNRRAIRHAAVAGGSGTSPSGLISAAEPLIAAALSAPPTEPVPISGYLAFDDTLRFVVASALTPVDAPIPGYTPEDRGVLFGWRDIDGSFAESVGQRLDLADARIAGSTPADDSLSIPLRSFDGLPVGHLVWTAPALGQSGLFPLLAAIVLVMAAITIAAALLYRRMSRLLSAMSEQAHVNRDLAQAFQAESGKHRATLDRLNAEQSRMQAVFDATLDGILICDENGVIADANPAIERIFGLAPSEIVGCRLADTLIPERFRNAHAAGLERLKSGGNSVVLGRRLEMPALHADGSEIYVEMTIAEFRVDGHRSYSAALRDITGRKRLDDMKSEFVSVVSHELRTPLTSILGALRLLNHDTVGAIPPAERGLVDIARRNAERLVRLVNDVLDLERIEGGRLDLAGTVIDLPGFINSTLADNTVLGDAHGIRFVLTSRSDHVEVRADPDRLTQVVINLLSNAVKFSPLGSTVDVVVERNLNHARVEVRDHGPGIPASFRSRIFERFAQADASDTRSASGTGLGLSICKSIIEQLGGTIGYENRSAGGATFYFELPVVDQDRSAA